VLVVVAFALFIDYMMYGLVVPLTPYSPAHVRGEAQLGLLYGGYAAGVLIATPLFGYLGNKNGCKMPMLCGVVLMTIATVLFAFGTNFAMLLIARVLQGASAAASWTAGLALVAEHYQDKRVQMIGLAMVGSTAGSIVGPMLGSTLFEIGGYFLPFQIAACLVTIDIVMRVFLLPQGSPSEQSVDELKSLVFDKSVLAAAFAVAVAASAWGLIEPLLPGHIEKSQLASPHQIGPMFTVSTIAYGLMAPVVNYASEKFSIKKTICVGMIFMAVSLPLLGVFPSVVMTGAMLCLVSMAYAFVLNPTSAELANAVDRRGLTCYTAVYAVYNIAYSLGMMGADFFAAGMAGRMTFVQSLLTMSAFLILGIPIMLRGVAEPKKLDF